MSSVELDNQFADIRFVRLSAIKYEIFNVFCVFSDLLKNTILF
jgi:hypothetical protein